MLLDGRGATTFEFVIVLPLCMMLIVAIVAWGWYWYSRTVMVLAIHEGGRSAAARYGSVEAGNRTFQNVSGAFLGRGNAAAYDGSWQIWESPHTRSVRGELYKAYRRRVPFFGEYLFVVRGGTFQRRWLFYPGPPMWWE